MELEDFEQDCGDCKHFSFSEETHKFHCGQHEFAVVYKTDLQPCEWYEEAQYLDQEEGAGYDI